MNLGTDRKKIEKVVLGVLIAGGGYLFYSNVLSGPPETPRAHPVTTAPHAGVVPAEEASDVIRLATHRALPPSRSGEEYRPSLKPKRPEERVDPMSIDPTLRLDLLAKVQAVDMQGGTRNLFQFSTAPPPPLPKEPTVALGKGAAAAANKAKQPPPGPPQPVTPQAPPIQLKYYGYSSARDDNRKHAFFLDGDDILVAGEGEVLKKRYRVVRIGVNSVVMEDTQFKHEQTLPLQEEAAG